MRIGIFQATLPQPGRKPGGVDVAVHHLANALATGGQDRVTVLSLSPPPADARYAHRHLFPNASWLTRSKFLRLSLVPALLNGCDLDRDLDVLHLHGDDWFYLRRNCPTVRTLHGSALFEARTATSLKRRVSQYLIYGLEHAAARLGTVSLGVGPETVGLYAADGLIDNGVDTSCFYPGDKSPAPRVLFVGTWAGRKRGAFLHEQFVRTIRPAVPDAELVMVSDECPPADGVRHVITPDDTTLAALFRSAWVFAYPSVYEGFGIPYLEALASGTAVVTSPNQGAARVLRNGQFGHVVDDSSFAAAVIRLLTDAAERDRLGSAGRTEANRFAWGRVADAHRAVYRSAITRWRGEAETA